MQVRGQGAKVLSRGVGRLAGTDYSVFLVSAHALATPLLVLSWSLPSVRPFYHSLLVVTFSRILFHASHSFLQYLSLLRYISSLFYSYLLVLTVPSILSISICINVSSGSY